MNLCKPNLIACLALVALPTGTPLYAQGHNYKEALQKALFFYEAQAAGVLRPDNRVEWRGNSTLRDGSDVGRNLAGGWFDAGDGVVWTSNNAFGATMLAWALTTYRQEFVISGQYARGLDALKHGTDYLLRCVDPSSPTGFRIYVGKGAIANNPPNDPAATNDRSGYWPHELLDAINISNGLPASVRPSYWVDTAVGGADVAGHVSAAMASASIVFRQGRETAYADSLLAMARSVYAFGEVYPNASTITRRLTNGNVVNLPSYPNRSSAWSKSMIFGAAWLHRAEIAAGTFGYTAAYIDKAEALYNSTAHSSYRLKHWRNLSPGEADMGAYAMLAADSGRVAFVTESNNYANFWVNDRSNATGRTTDPTLTPGGFVARTQGPGWNVHTLLDQAPPLLEWADSSFNTNATQKANLIGLFTGTYTNSSGLVHGVRQIDYILGDNPSGMSFLQGYSKPGGRWINNLHYRGATFMHSGFGTPMGEIPAENTFTTYGLLGPGPNHQDFYPGMNSPVTATVIGYQEPIIYSGGLLSVLARRIQQTGAASGEPLAVFPDMLSRSETYQTDDFFVAAYQRTDSAPTNGIRVVAQLCNRASLPAREVPSIGFRLYFSLDGTLDPSRVTMGGFWPSVFGSETCTWSGPTAAGGNLYYFEIRFANASVGPGEYNNWRRTVEFSINQSSGVWDSSNDFSFASLPATSGTGGVAALCPDIPVYDFSSTPATVLGGFAPGAGTIRWRHHHVANATEKASAVFLIAERVGGDTGAVGASFTTSDDTAIAGLDYMASTGSVFWADGESGEQLVSVQLMDDALFEARPQFLITLFSPTGGAVLSHNPTSRVYIEDDDFDGPARTEHDPETYGWAFANIGNTTTPGSAAWQSASAGLVAGAGAQGLRQGSNATRDAFGFTTKTMVGDGSITIRLTNVDNPGGAIGARSGLMIREGQAANARYVALVIQPNGTIYFMRRTATGGAVAQNNVTAQTLPRWLRLARTGNVFRAFRSSDGVVWTQVGNNLTLALATDTLAGVVAASSNDSNTCSGVFDNLTFFP